MFYPTTQHNPSLISWRIGANPTGFTCTHFIIQLVMNIDWVKKRKIWRKGE